MALPKVLVIEDNPADIELIRIMLGRELGPHHFEVLRDGEAALAFIRAHRAGGFDTDPCVIVLDLGLPRHDGITVLEEVRRSPVLTHIKVVVISSAASPADQARIQELGGFFRQKPSNLDECAVLASFIADCCRGEVSAVAHK